MTSTNSSKEVFKQDSRGRVRVSRPRRDELLDEFAKSGLSGAAFARMVVIKYATFANWVQQRRKRQGSERVLGPGTPVRLLEAVLEEHSAQSRPETNGLSGLWLELPGGCRLRVETPVQLAMAAELVSLVAQSTRARC